MNTDCISTVSSLMPSSSKFSGSDVESIFDETIGEYFDRMEIRIEDLLDAPFLTRASGEYLDLIHGRLYGLDRLPDESDDDYRIRLGFKARDGFPITELAKLGCTVYVCDDAEVTGMTLLSRNTSAGTGLVVECPDDSIEDLIKDNLIYDGVVFI